MPPADSDKHEHASTAWDKKNLCTCGVYRCSILLGIDVTNRSGDKGARGELEVQELLREELALPNVRRALGAGRKDDVGDIDGVPQTAIQVAWWNNPMTAINAKIESTEQQRRNKRVRFAALFVRRTRAKSGPKWIVVMTPTQWAKMYRYAVMGVALEREQKSGKMLPRDTAAPR